MWLGITVVIFVLALASTAAVGRLRPSGNFLVRFVTCGGLAWATLIGIEVAIGGMSVETVAALVLFAFAWELSIFLFAFVTTSVSVGLLVRLRAGPRSEVDLAKAYTTDFMVETRLERLIRDGFLVPVGSGYGLTRKSRVVLRAFNTLSSFFRHTPSAPTGVARHARTHAS